MPNNEISTFTLINNLQHFTSQIHFVKKIVQNEIKEVSFKEKLIKEIQKLQKIIKSIKKQAKDLKLTDLQLAEIYDSSFTYIENKLRQVIYPVKLQKSDFELYMIKRQLKQNQSTCGISMNIDTEKHDDRMLIQANLVQVIDIEYHRFSVKSLLVKASQIMKNFKYHPVIYSQHNDQIDLLMHEITKNYNIIPYHNFTHAFSVFSMFYYFAKSQSLSNQITDFELYFSLIACLCHDLRHNGVNSIFEAKSKSDLALNFGNISILQKMHKSVAFQILDSLGQNSPFQTLSLEEKKNAKKIIVNCILATDMARHYDYVSCLKQKKIDLSKSDDKLELMESLIHACDIGNSMLDHENYLTWANLVCVQFHQQTIKQETNNLEVTNHMKFQSLNYFYKNQATFLSTIVLPMWQCLDQQLNESKIKEKLKLIKQNSKKVSQQMRRNSDCQPKNNLAKYLGNLLKELKL